MKKIISLLLVLILVCSLLPLSAMAAKKENPKGADGIKVTDTLENGKNKFEGKDKDNDKGNDKDGHKHKKQKPVYYHPANEHEFGYASNPTYHWLQCACGCKINMEPHVDPLDATDDYCFCGYHFSDNADLVTLWLQDCKELKNFRKDVYEYETDAYTYKEVNEIKRIATSTFDSEATVELPEDLTLKEGENKIEIKVIAENKKVTQTYTVIVNKEAKK